MTGSGPGRIAASPGQPILQFLGGAGTVTGSRFLLDLPEGAMLVDCGLFQGIKRLRLRNWEHFPVDPAALAAVVLTHAHIDHSGYLPRLVRQGFSGPVHATPDTTRLCGIVLPDSGHLQEEDAAYANRKGFSKHDPAVPLYTEADARASLELFEPMAFSQQWSPLPSVGAVLRPAGHILGSATLRLTLDGPDERVVVFSGDLGRHEHPLLVDATPIGRADVVVVESTYGNRNHVEAGVEELADIVRRTAARGGTVVIPAFAVDRTEIILHLLSELRQAEEIPDIPIHVDSPMALSALRVYRAAFGAGAPDVDPELRRRDPFEAIDPIEARSVEESKALDRSRYPSIIISAAGMASGGRVLHHLRARLGDRRNAVVLVGFQAAGTRGRRLADGEQVIKLLGHYQPVRAEVVQIEGLSVHADADDLVAWVASSSPLPELVLVVHGEAEGSQALADRLHDELGVTAAVPQHLERVLLGP